LTALSSRAAITGGKVKLPSLSTFNAGLRYRFRLLNAQCSARIDIANVADSTGLTISSIQAIFPQLRRNYTLTFAADT
jgi:hypothetical protein